MNKLEQEVEERKIMFQSSIQSPRILRKKSPNKITGWDDQDSNMIQQVIKDKLKNTTDTFRIKPARAIYDKLTIRKPFFPSKQKSLSIQPAVITKLKEQLKYLESPKKKPTRNNLPKVSNVDQKPSNQEPQTNSKINSLINGSESPLKTMRLFRNPFFQKRASKSQRGTPSKKKFGQQHTEDFNLTVFKQKILNMMNRHTIPLQMTIHKKRAISQLRNRNPTQSKNNSPNKSPEQFDSYLKIQEFKMPVFPSYKLVISDQQKQSNRKHPENKIYMSRMI